MQDIILSLNNNILKVITIDKGGFHSASAEVDYEIANDSVITNVPRFSQKALELISGLSDSKTIKKGNLIFAVHPQDVILKFVTLSKSTQNVEEAVSEEIKAKLDGSDIADLYYSYSKIAPFVYQIVAVKKFELEKFIEVSNEMGIPLAGIYPWMSLLPVYLNLNEPCIFVTRVNNEQVVALSELNGIFYTGIYEHDKSEEELEALVKDLSVYKRKSPITKIYTLNYDSFDPDNGFQIFKIDVPGADQENALGYEVNLLISYLLEANNDLPISSHNLLNLLPLPTVESRKLPVAAAVTGVVMLLVLAAGGYFVYSRSQQSDKTALNPSAANEVLSDSTTQTPESTQSGDGGAVVGTETQKPELKKEDLKIRIENGANINGAAASVQEKLKTLGYNVVSIGTASSSRQTTLLSFKSDKEAYKDLVLTDSKDFAPDTEVNNTLQADLEYDLLLVLGTSIEL